MSKTNNFEDKFFIYAKMAGIIQVKPNKFLFDEKEYRVNASVSPEVAAAFGGKRRAFKLLRYAAMVEHACSTPGNNHLFDMVRGGFEPLCEMYPMLRSYYEAARVGGRLHTWMRWAR